MAFVRLIGETLYDGCLVSGAAASTTVDATTITAGSAVTCVHRHRDSEWPEASRRARHSVAARVPRASIPAPFAVSVSRPLSASGLPKLCLTGWLNLSLAQYRGDENWEVRCK